MASAGDAKGARMPQLAFENLSRTCTKIANRPEQSQGRND
jgi:hypothetical protein